MIQEINPDCTNASSASHTLALNELKKRRLLKVHAAASLPAVYIYDRVGPTFPEEGLFTPPADQGFEKSRNVYYIWLFAHVLSSISIQLVSGFGGFVSATGVTPERKSTIDCFPPINQPFSDYALIVELLQNMHRAGQCCFELLALIGSPQLL